MKKILFIGHDYHEKTGSSFFFQQLLRCEYQLVNYKIDRNKDIAIRSLANLRLSDYDCVCLWQIDYLASYFIRRGLHTIVCPMYDASSTLDHVHWQAMKGALILCFSLELYFRIQEAGCSAVYLKYFPDLDDIYRDLLPTDTTSYPYLSTRNRRHRTGLKVFFWERLPDSSLNLYTVIKLLAGLPISHLHVHQAPDPGCKPTNIPINNLYPITKSSWFTSKDEYIRLLNDSDIYVAPRFSEGIGMGFLEAMTLGCCVIAHDMPTHNEYITSFENGILVDFLSSKDYPLSETASTIRSLGTAAKAYAKISSEGWKNFYVNLLFSSISTYIDTHELPSRLPPLLLNTVTRLRSLEELQYLFCAHADWDSYWAHLSAQPPESLRETHLSYPLMPHVNRLVINGRVEQASDCLKAAITKYPNENTPYHLFARQFDEQCNYVLGSSTRASAH